MDASLGAISFYVAVLPFEPFPCCHSVYRSSLKPWTDECSLGTIVGATPAVDIHCQAFPEAANRHTGAGPAGAQPRHTGQRQPRPAGQGLHLLETAVH